MCVRGVIDKDWVHRLRKAVEEVPGGYADRIFMWKFNDIFKEFAFDSPIGELGATFMSSHSCGLIADVIFVKHPQSNDTTPWHHDVPYYQTQGSDLCGIWLGLDQRNLDNGGLRWVKGSHKWGRLFEPELFDGHATTAVDTEQDPLPDIDNDPSNYNIVSFETEPGDCIVSHSLALHAGGANPTAYPRRAIAYHCYGDNARFKSIPPSQGFEDSRDLGLKDGDPFPADHELVPRLWPKRPRTQWPSPRNWKNHPGALLPYNDDIAKLMSGKS